MFFTSAPPPDTTRAFGTKSPYAKDGLLGQLIPYIRPTYHQSFDTVYKSLQYTKT